MLAYVEPGGVTVLEIFVVVLVIVVVLALVAGLVLFVRWVWRSGGG
ncbi:MAG: hypothetical protein IPK93_07490 [Solirubrobacterales bacterium]|nr:hypothetical protein [Solirubrobacterales bacterium]